MDNVREVLESYGYKICAENQGFYRTAALYRNGDNTNCLSINKKTGFFTDFKTQETGSLEKLIKLTTGEIVSYNLETPSCNIVLQDDINEMNPDDVFPLLPSFSYYEKRGISKETLVYYEGGVCTRGIMNDRFVFPITNSNGEIVGFAGRDLLNKPHRPKWKLIGKKTTWDYPNYYNKEFIIKQKSVILVEGISDMLALHEAGYYNILVLFGLKMSPALLSTLLSLSLDKIVIGLNNDEDHTTGVNVGGEASKKLKTQLDQWFDCDKVRIVTPTQNDFSDMSKDELNELLKELK